MNLSQRKLSFQALKCVLEALEGSGSPSFVSPVPTGRNRNSLWQNGLKKKKKNSKVLWDPRVTEMVLRISLVNSACGDLAVEYLIGCICLSQWNLYFNIVLLEF